MHPRCILSPLHFSIQQQIRVFYPGFVAGHVADQLVTTGYRLCDIHRTDSLANE